MERASSYETTMKEGTIYRMLRIQYSDTDSKIAAPSDEEEFINELNISLFNFRPDSDMPIYNSVDELSADLDPCDTFVVRTGDAYALVNASNLSLDEIKNVLRSMNG